mgnify:CR=1 FL=1
MSKWVYLFSEADWKNKDLFGGKGANLARMVSLNLPVPPGFIITTSACIEYFERGNRLWDELLDEVFANLAKLEDSLGKRLGDSENPLLVSVRSGAKFSMPGMMDTILNLGLNDSTVQGLAKKSRNPRFAFDCYRRFIQIFSEVVFQVPHEAFESALAEAKRRVGARYDHEIPPEELQRLINEYKEIVRKNSDGVIPDDPREQLKLAIGAVFESWNSPRAISYRNLNRIPHNLGTACTVQAMVFGNMGERSATGVAFSRNPSTGEWKIYGEYLVNAQGEDVVAGVRTPQPLENMTEEMPEVAAELFGHIRALDEHYKDMQDVEFTIEEGKLYILQTRAGKRTGLAAIRIAVESCQAGYYDKETAVMMVEPGAVEQVLHKSVDSSGAKPVAQGLNASPGGAVGKIVLDPDRAEAMAKAGERVILVREETVPDDIHGLAVSEGVLTARGGMTSHAAVVARGMGKPCVAGCGALRIDNEERKIAFAGADVTLSEGDVITIDGTNGYVYVGNLPLIEPKLTDEFAVLLSWADEIRRLGIRTNADTPEDARRAYEFGAEGIGLTRTEHMFMQKERLPFVQAMILAETPQERREHLFKIKDFQVEDFKGIFREMKGYPVTIRLLDPPLHEFLPSDDEELEEVIRSVKGQVSEADFQNLKKRAIALREANPMLGFRGCRLGILYPEISEMQIEAILESAIAVKNEGITVRPEIMIPLTGSVQELRILKDLTKKVAERVFQRLNDRVDFLFGTMIEVPRAALTADEVAEVAEFFSFGTNDLTQMTLGISRDDAEEKFLKDYVQLGIYEANPFAELDEQGVGKLVRMAVELGRAVRKDLKVGICGEHGGDPKSIDFCHRVKMDYVSCSPFRVPVARLAAAQSAVRERTSVQAGDTR